MKNKRQNTVLQKKTRNQSTYIGNREKQFFIQQKNLYIFALGKKSQFFELVVESSVCRLGVAAGGMDFCGGVVFRGQREFVKEHHGAH